ncbi:MAG TPA: hypothetical protein VFU02_01605 [Polyangiaceae bacterium]|nr:hypothetical protein [Polyangiaceae bacterium]
MDSSELEQLVARVLAMPAEWTDHPNAAFNDPAFRSLFDGLRSGSHELRNTAVARLVAGLDASDAYQAARVALTIGTLVEYGAAPELAAEAVLGRLEAELIEPSQDSARHRRIVKFLGLAGMAMLSRSPSLRQAARRRTRLRAAVDDSDVSEAGFIARTLELVDDLPLLVLHMERPEAFKLRIDAVASIFHFMTLLADRFPEWCGDDPPDPDLSAIARGEVPLTTNTSDHARFHLFDYSGLDRHPGSSLWGEASPASIPSLDGERVVLVGRKLFGSRSWDATFFANFHDALLSSVRVEARLSAAEYEHWLARVRAQLPAPKPQ